MLPRAGSRRVVSTSRDDTLRIWDGAKGLQALTVIKHYNNTGAAPPLPPAGRSCGAGRQPCEAALVEH